ncbi:hypothetical protein [Heliothis virescens ascovirus 3h]|uniref:Uncharacterized protein n=1 Tax=Heliothis virescens ascovirus 3h TaxID=1268039 RepID=A0A386JAR3_9VIRU|nr:hypothetical protein [Heliothis virescens ascovirus 3h]
MTLYDVTESIRMCLYDMSDTRRLCDNVNSLLSSFPGEHRLVISRDGTKFYGTLHTLHLLVSRCIGSRELKEAAYARCSTAVLSFCNTYNDEEKRCIENLCSRFVGEDNNHFRTFEEVGGHNLDMIVLSCMYSTFLFSTWYAVDHVFNRAAIHSHLEATCRNMLGPVIITHCVVSNECVIEDLLSWARRRALEFRSQLRARRRLLLLDIEQDEYDSAYSDNYEEEEDNEDDK